MAEQLLLGAAAGMAQAGLVPLASTYSVFATRRAYDFLCLDAAEPKLNVNVVGGLPGLTTGYGPSHQATEDVAIFRGIPGLTIVDPCDSVDIDQAVPQLAAIPGPSYLRLLRGRVPTVLDEYDYTFELGRAKVLRSGRDVVFVSSGLMTMRALLAAERLAAHHVDVAVVHSPTLKPFDTATVLAELDTDRLAVTLENHTVVGGLFETVAAAAIRAGLPGASNRSPYQTPSSTPERCPPCTTGTAWRPSGSSSEFSERYEHHSRSQRAHSNEPARAGFGIVAHRDHQRSAAAADPDGGDRCGPSGSARCATWTSHATTRSRRLSPPATRTRPQLLCTAT
jgi:transketolase C-terminal domain/subunit